MTLCKPPWRMHLLETPHSDSGSQRHVGSRNTPKQDSGLSHLCIFQDEAAPLSSVSPNPTYHLPLFTSLRVKAKREVSVTQYLLS